MTLILSFNCLILLFVSGEYGKNKSPRKFTLFSPSDSIIDESIPSHDVPLISPIEVIMYVINYLI